MDGVQMCKAEKGQTSLDILTYLASNPGAQDTLEGVAEWWLLEQKIKNHTAEVKEALEDLIWRGLVLEHRGKDERSHYRVNRRKLKEISKIIKLRLLPGE
jgi:hypothetical protein